MTVHTSSNDLKERKARQLVDLDEIRKYPIRANNYDENNGKLDFVLGIEALMEYIESLSTVDADHDRGYIEGYTKAESDIYHGGEWERVKRGHWIWHGLVDHLGRPTGRHFGECSRCGFKTRVFLNMPEVGLNWCGECGAKMDEAEE